MKYVLWAAVAYQAGIGLSEMFWVAAASPTAAGVAAWPSVSSLVDSSIGTSPNANWIEGGIDVGAAILIWAFFLRG